MTELLFQTQPKVDEKAVVARVNDLVGSDAVLPESATQLHIFHKKYPIKYDDGTVPAQTVLMGTDKPTEKGAFEDRIQQSWSCANAAELVRGASNTMMLTEIMSGVLEPGLRLDLFHAVLQACIEVTNPIALCFTHSFQIVDPREYLASCDGLRQDRLGVFNVRFYNISNQSPGEMIMDTRGLTEIGLPDLQCHFRDLPPNEVAGQISNIARYIVEKGPVIESGHTIQGIDSADPWHCRYEESMLDPKREVIDLNPGEPYAAGKRERS